MMKTPEDKLFNIHQDIHLKPDENRVLLYLKLFRLPRETYMDQRKLLKGLHLTIKGHSVIKIALYL